MQAFGRHTLVLTLVILCGINYVQSVAVSDDVWDEYKRDFKKTYASRIEENNARYYYAYNLNLITNHNIQADRGQYTYRLKRNQFSDLRLIQFNAIFSETTQPPLSNTNAKPLPTLSDHLTPPVYNPFNFGVSPNIKAQGNLCSSGFAYATSSSIELFHSQQMGLAQPKKLSAQQIIDCARTQVPDGAFDYMTCYGIDLKAEIDYPNKNETSTPLPCTLNPKSPTGIEVLEYSRIADGDDASLAKYVSAGFPVVVHFNPTSFQYMHYSEGMFTQPATGRGSHYMVVVGYDEQSWLLQNSFGTEWGEAGYMRLKRNDARAKLPNSATLPTMLGGQIYNIPQ